METLKAHFGAPRDAISSWIQRVEALAGRYAGALAVLFAAKGSEFGRAEGAEGGCIPCSRGKGAVLEGEDERIG